MKTIKNYLLRRAIAVLATALALSAMFAPSADASIYQMASNYPAGTVPPFNAGGGVPAQAFLTLDSVNPTNNTSTLAWYGMMGWYAVQATTNALSTNGPWILITNVPATDFAWQVTVTNPFPNGALFRLSQTNAFAGSGACGGCHGDKYSTYLKTLHAAAFSSPSAISNFALIARTVGLGQPTGFTDSTNTPYLENVGCENCHGPASWHKNSDHDLIRPAVSLDPTICGSCHQGNLHPTYEEYTTANTVGLFPGLSHSHPTQPPATANGCQVCHSANNRMVMLGEYEDMLAGNPHPLSLYTGSDATIWTATCATCHDPHELIQANGAQLRNPTFSTNWFTMPTTFDTRTITNADGSTSVVNYNTVFDSVYDPDIQVCAQCHNTRGARWDGNSYAVSTNTPLYGTVTNTVYFDIYCTNTVTQVFTNEQGVPYLTNSYTYTYVCGRGATNVVTLSQTNPVYGVSVVTSLIAYTNGGVTMFTTNSSGYGRIIHYSPQYNILVGKGDYDYTNFVPTATHAHTSAEDQCTSCHVPSYAVNANTNYTGHTFNMDVNGCWNAGCHTSYTADALTNKIRNLQFIESNNMVRVASMLNQWALTKATGPLTNYAQMAWEYTIPGMLSSPDASHTGGPPSAYSSRLGPVPSGTNDNLQLQIPQDIRLARYDLYLAYNDQSIGVHNPSYVQVLLDDAARRVSGQFSNANFTANTVAGFAPLTVKFSNLGTGITGYSWTFGDTHTATIANPTNVYTTPGIYTVTFTATTAGGTETLIKTNYIRAITTPILSLVADQTNVALGTTVNFTSTSTSTADVFRWTWYPRYNVSGAPSYDTAGGSPFFSYTYTNGGIFTVSLRATCPGGANGSYNRVQVYNTNYVNVVGANFAALSTNAVAGVPVAFTNKSGGATSYFWTFGDGNTSAAVNPVNTYANVGTYTVSLTAINNGVSNTMTLPNYVVVHPPPLAAFSGTPRTVQHRSR
jgi:PKD repeat protein